METMHSLYQVVAAHAVRPYVIEVEFDDGVQVSIDLEQVLYGDLYGPLRDPVVFAQVTVDPEVHTVTWPNGADFDPETLHDWDSHKADFLETVESWRSGIRA